MVRSDISRVVDICNACFSEDELFRWLYPHQDKYPNDLRRFQLIRLRTRFVQQGSQGYVAETEPGCACKGCNGEAVARIVGFGFFIREGNDEVAQKWRAESWATKFERYLLSWDQWYELTFLQRANDPEAGATFARAEEHKFYKMLRDYWLLGLLCVDPACQKRGIGQRIIEHGLKVAAGENKPVALDASAAGRPLYQKLGFKTVQGTVFDDGVMGSGWSMLWEPPGFEGVWLEDGSDGEFKLRTSQ